MSAKVRAQIASLRRLLRVVRRQRGIVFDLDGTLTKKQNQRFLDNLRKAIGPNPEGIPFRLIEEQIGKGMSISKNFFKEERHRRILYDIAISDDLIVDADVADFASEVIHRIDTNVMPVIAILTGRYERKRDITERWLYENGLRFEFTIMLPDSVPLEFRHEWKFDILNGIEEIVGIVEDDAAVIPFAREYHGIVFLVGHSKIDAEHSGNVVACPDLFAVENRIREFKSTLHRAHLLGLE